MVFQSDTYSVLLVSASEKMNTAMLSLLPSTDFWPVTAVGSVSLARRHIGETAYDLVLVNSPLPDGSGIQLSIDACAQGETCVLLLVWSDRYEEIQAKVLPHGVVTLPKPTSRDVVFQTIRALCAMRERLRLARGRQATVEEKMEELRLVNRAKWVLIRERGLTEEEAHRQIQVRAMEQHKTKREVAEEIVRESPEREAAPPPEA